MVNRPKSINGDLSVMIQNISISISVLILLSLLKQKKFETVFAISIKWTEL